MKSRAKRKYEVKCLVCGLTHLAIRKTQKYCSWICKNIGVNKSRIPNLIGKKVGKLIVLNKLGSTNHGVQWLCKCDCGNTTKLTTAVLNSKKPTLSCGCLVKENLRKRHKEKGESAFNSLYLSYWHSAKRRGLEFNLNKEEFKKITSDNCFYCNSVPISGKYKENVCNGAYIYNGIDRVDNDKGYELNNIVPCCEKCNRMKLKMKKEEFLSQIEKIFNHQKSLDKGV